LNFQIIIANPNIMYLTLTRLKLSRKKKIFDEEMKGLRNIAKRENAKV